MTIDPSIIHVLQILSDYFRSKSYRFIVIGANVPLILINQREVNGKGFGIRPTKDVDLLVEVENWEDFHQLRNDLMALGFKQKELQPEHRFFMGYQMIDILPYGNAIAPEGYIEWPSTGHRMNVIGFDKLFEHAKEESITEDFKIPLIPLPLLVYTKIITYEDRKLSKDVIDILYVLEHYEEISVSTRRFEIADEQELTYEERGAYLVGQDLKAIISDKESQIVDDFLKLFDSEYAEIVQKISWESKKKAKDVLELFHAFERGMEIMND